MNNPVTDMPIKGFCDRIVLCTIRYHLCHALEMIVKFVNNVRQTARKVKLRNHEDDDDERIAARVPIVLVDM